MRFGYREYVPVHQRLANGIRDAKKRLKKGQTLQPCVVEGRTIAKTFWGSSWCEHLEKYSDFSNRLPRGRTYARNGSVVHLEISSGRIDAMVAGSDLYTIKIDIDKLPPKAWKQLCEQCTGSVASMIDLLQGRLPDEMIATLTNPKTGLFPLSKQIHLRCDCPDWASLCKHLAAVLYAIGNRLDDSPELLFLLRGVDQNDLISKSLVETVGATTGIEGATVLDSSSLEDIFGINLVDTPGNVGRKKKRSTSKSAKKKKAASGKGRRKKAVRKKSKKTHPRKKLKRTR